MPPDLSPLSGISSNNGDIDLELLQNTQAYLECRSQRRTPDCHLVEAWDQFYDTCDPLIRRFAGAWRVPEADLNDCVQQVWVELVGKLRHYDPRRGRFRSWLYTLVHSRVTDLLRDRVHHPTGTLSSEMEERLCGRDSDPAAECERRWERVAVREVFALLHRRVSPANFLLLYLRWMEGWTVRDVAGLLGLTPPQVWIREHRVKHRFRRLFERYTNGKGNETSP